MEARADEQLSSYFYTYVPVRARTSLKKQLLSCSSALASYPKCIYYSIDETSFHILRIEKKCYFLVYLYFFSYLCRNNFNTSHYATNDHVGQ